MIRLDKYLADMGIGTRAEVKKYVRQGKVKIDGKIVKSPEEKVDIATQEVSFLDQTVSYETFEYYRLNKPAGVISATMDAKEKTVKKESDPFVENNQNEKCFLVAQAEDLESLYQQASQNEKVRLRIVGDYLTSLQGSGAPITKSGAGLLVTPTSRAKSITEAGGMALRFFENGGRA